VSRAGRNFMKHIVNLCAGAAATLLGGVFIYKVRSVR
jgi:hypothetical protein